MKNKEIIKGLKKFKKMLEINKAKFRNEINILENAIKIIETQEKIINRYETDKDITLFK